MWRSSARQSKRTTRIHSQEAPRFEPLEPRLLLSGDFTVTVNPLITNNNTPFLDGDIIPGHSGYTAVTVNNNTYEAFNWGDYWYIDLDYQTPLPDGTYDVQVRVTTWYGDWGADDTTNELTIDTVAPTATVTGKTTADSTPSLSGTVNDATATVRVAVNGRTYNAVNDGEGGWTANVTHVVPDGTYNVQVSATDLAGNVGHDGTTNELSVDATRPTADITDVSPDPRNTAANSIGIVFSEEVTGFTKDNLALTLDGAGVDLTMTTLTTADNITWTLGNLSGLTNGEGTYVLTLTGTGVADALGNAFSGAPTDTWVMDTTAPTVTVDALGTIDTTPALTGTVNDATATISVNVNGSDYAATNNEDGTWTLADNTVVALARGIYDVSVTATDVAGNAGQDATANELTIGYREIVTLGGQGNPSRIVFVDADGSTVVVRASRTGSLVLTLESMDEISNVQTDSRPRYSSASGISLEGIVVAADTYKLTIASRGGTVQGTEVGTVTGDATLTTLRADSVDLVNGIDMDGVIGSLRARDLSGDVTMNGLYDPGVCIQVRRDIAQSIITLTSSDVRRFITGTMIDSTLRVQLADAPALGAPGDLHKPALGGQIDQIRIRGYRGASGDYMVNSNIEAHHIRRAYVRGVQLDNDGQDFGFLADQIDLLRLHQDKNSYRYGRNWLDDPIDFVVQVV
jgi:hypothetical protein